MTYKEIQKKYQELYQHTIKSCWIADVKNEMGLTKKLANNRIEVNFRKCPCPNDEIRERIKAIIQGFN